MMRDEGGLAWIFRDDDWQDCADTLAAADYPEEFALSTYLDADAVEAACLAGFMPMSARFMVHPGFPYGEPEIPAEELSGQDGETRIFYTPKLHLVRCVLDPSEARITTTARRASRHFRVSVNKAFEETLAACIGTHGDGWLTPALTRVFTELHTSLAIRQVKLVSVELWKDGTLVAGELGYAAGSAYASLSGFRRLSGAGSVQLAALAGILAESGYRVWDLGMPMEYKTALGCLSLPRHEYLPLLRAAYHHETDKNLEIHFEPAPVRLPFACTRSGCS
jgi:leucyl/phenylalanyl-tRNA--protein transferase